MAIALAQTDPFTTTSRFSPKGNAEGISPEPKTMEEITATQSSPLAGTHQERHLSCNFA